MLIPRHCQSALDVVGLMQIRIAAGILKHVFSYGQKGHRIAECPQRKEVQTIPRPTTGQYQGASQKPKIQGRVYVLTQQDANISNAVVTGIIPISTTYAYALFDPGATHSFISSKIGRASCRERVSPYV